MKLSRIIVLSKAEEALLVNYMKGTRLYLKAGTSFAGEKGNLEFNHGRKGTEVIFKIGTEKAKNYKELTSDDIDDYDITEIDVYEHNEHRNIVDTTYEIFEVIPADEEVKYWEVFLKEI